MFEKEEAKIESEKKKMRKLNNLKMKIKRLTKEKT